MYLKELIQQSWTALRRNRMRSVLTMLGISWGVVSLVLAARLRRRAGRWHSQGNRRSMGNNVIVIWPGQTSMQAGGQRAGRKIHYEYEDVQALRSEIPIIRAVSAESVTDFGFKAGTRVVSIQTRGVEFPYAAMRNLVAAEGRNIEEGEFTSRKPVVLLGHAAAKRIFQGAPAVGQTVLVQGRAFEVVGVMDIKIQDNMYEGPDNEQAFIPYEVFNELTNAATRRWSSSSRCRRNCIPPPSWLRET